MREGVTIRPAVRADVPQIWEFIKQLADFERLLQNVVGSPEELEHWVFNEPVPEVLVAELDSKLVGHAIYFKNFSTFKTKPGIYLEDLYVLPEHRGSGIGKGLILEVIETGRRRGFGRVEWSVLDWNQSAIDFYLSIGAQTMDDWRLCRVSL